MTDAMRLSAIAHTAVALMADAADEAEASGRPKLAARMREIRSRFAFVLRAGLSGEESQA